MIQGLGALFVVWLLASQSEITAQGSVQDRTSPQVGSSAMNTPERDQEVRRIRALLERQQADWNRADIDAFMQGYEKSESLVFTSGGKVRRGWQATLQRYKESYPDRAAMGQLSFTDLEITIVDSHAGVVLGKWALARAQDHPQGVFTLVLRRGADGWKIIHDHTSSLP